MADQLSPDWLGLAGRVCVVTGAGGGIGRSVAVNLAKAGAQVAALDRDEQGLEKTRAELVRVGSTTVGRLTLQPGWQWSECIKPVVGTDSCQVRHVGIVQAGTLHVVHDDGTEEDLEAGDAYIIEPGHDASVVGDEPWVGFEFESRAAEEYART